MEKTKKIIMPENLLSVFIIMCPILDILSFLFRNKFQTNYSVSTFIRPIIPAILFIYIFFKSDTNKKGKMITIGFIYAIYAVIHVLIYNRLKTECSYGTITHEMQYLINYSFMILNLYVFNKTIDEKNEYKLHQSIIISLSIYIVSIYISMLSGTSSTTYIEGIGFKGWFESGNSISAILVLGTFIVMSFIMKVDNRICKGIIFLIICLVGIYLMTLIGTRVGLIGFILSILCFIISQILEKSIAKVKINKKNFIILFSILILLLIVVIVAGSLTLKRRKYLQSMEHTVIDESTGSISHLTGDLTAIRNRIVNNELEEGFMTEQQKQSILNLYDIAEKYNISNTNTRMQQLIYHCMLVRNQKNIVLILFGNGYLINTNELVWEMEFPAFLFNFGIIGFLLYMVPFITIVAKACICLMKKIKSIDTEFIMLFLAVGLSFVLSTLSGYTFFNSSSMIIIIVANVLLNNKVKKLKEKK